MATQTQTKTNTQAGTGVQLSVDELIALRFDAVGLNRRRPVASRLAGDHLSKFRGRGMSFAENRIYQPGDDIRHMDWRVTARTGKPHTKVFQEEQQRPVFFLLDFGPSMRFGTRVAFKHIIAARMATLIAWSTVKRGDRLGAQVFSGNQHRELKPCGGQRGVLRLIRLLVESSQQTPTAADPADLNQALQRLRHVIRPGSIIFIFSDFYHFDEDAQRHLTLLAQHNDTIAGMISDPLEEALPKPGYYDMTDGDNIIRLNTSGQPLRQRYQYDFQQHQHQVMTNCHRCGTQYFHLRTDTPLVETLKQYFASL